MIFYIWSSLGRFEINWINICLWSTIDIGMFGIKISDVDSLKYFFDVVYCLTNELNFR